MWMFLCLVFGVGVVGGSQSLQWSPSPSAVLGDGKQNPEPGSTWKSRSWMQKSAF